MSPPRIFISYRRDDSSGHAGRLYDALADHFGSENVFIDVDTIRIGSDFAETIDQAMADCDAVVALIGRDWTTAAYPGGELRLADAGDFVRIELETALSHGIAVVPVAVRGATFPDVGELPDSLKPLARRQGIELRDSAWRDDVNRLIRRIEGLRKNPQGETRPNTKERRSFKSKVLAAAAVVALVAIVSVIAVEESRGGAPSSGSHGNASLRAAVPAASRSTCVSISYGAPSAQASIECYSADVVADYNLFRSTTDMKDWYVQQEDTAGISPGTRDCTPTSFHREAPYGGGRYLCYFAGQGKSKPNVVWIDTKRRIGADASISSRIGTRAAHELLREWRCCFR